MLQPKKTKFRRSQTDKNPVIYFYISGLFCVTLLSACTDDLSDIMEKQEDELIPIGFTVSQEDAVAELNKLLLVIDNQEIEGNLRSSTKRRVIGNIGVVNRGKNDVNQNFLRSSASASESNEPLLYLVNFENDEGYAVLAADNRISSPVLAVVESGNISASDFIDGDYAPYDSSIDYGYEDLENFNLYNAEEDDYYVGLPMPTTYMLLEYAGHEVGGGGSPSTTRTETGAWVTNKKTDPMLTTVWHQRTPFNDACPQKRWFFWQSYKRAPAGCVAIAVSQIMAYHEYPQNLTCNGISIDWPSIKHLPNIDDPWATGISSERIAAAQLVSNIGAWCNTIYTRDWSFALPRKARDCMSLFGYSNVVRHTSYDKTKVIDMLDNNNPVFVAAISGIVSGHAWVVDGYIDRSRTIRKVNTSTEAVVSSTVENEVLVHCNWGWQGKSNGYYVSGIFNTKNGPKERESYEEDWESSSGSNFTWSFYMITYNHPN